MRTSNNSPHYESITVKNRNFAYMKKLIIDLKNCYGIKSLVHEFDFTEQNVYAIYAPNGSMKTSLAQTFKDVTQDVDSKDRIFLKRVTSRVITDENGTSIPPSDVFVISPYEQEFDPTEKTSTLLVNAPLKKEYEALHREIESAKELLLKTLKKQSGSKRDLEEEISTAITKDNNFRNALRRVKDEVHGLKDTSLSEVQYDTIFDQKSIDALKKKDFQTAIEDYIKRYAELLDKSTYFKKGIFEYYNATAIAKTLADNGFFIANHTVSLNGTDKPQVIKTQTELVDLIAKEKEGIDKDDKLRAKFAELEKLLDANVNTKTFRAYIIQNEHLLPHLTNIERFKEEVWKAFLKENEAMYLDLLDKYKDAENKEKEIEKKAQEESTRWEEAIDIFNDRFLVPFKLIAKNKISVMLGVDPLLAVGFEFIDGADRAPVDKETLLESLSQGEKKALYILNIIFEIEARRKSNQETLFIVDDIADSFDYKNKYAIIQYLKDIAEDPKVGEPKFRQVILTHNFDFFRVVESRFVKRRHCLMAMKNSTGIQLEAAVGIRNIFVKDWKKHFFTDKRKKVASISFMRNLVEYMRGEADTDFVTLTSLLHWKSDTGTITEGDLDGIYCRLFGGTTPPPQSTKLVIDIINDEADGCISETTVGINFEHKIVLSIAIRLYAEKFMVTKIADPAFMLTITKNQTSELVSKYKINYPTETSTIKVLEKVALMTPENIHLNSFMYEPILDMNDEHLRKLCGEVKSLT
jgi:hypothetical protein